MRGKEACPPTSTTHPHGPTLQHRGGDGVGPCQAGHREQLLGTRISKSGKEQDPSAVPQLGTTHVSGHFLIKHHDMWLLLSP